ncbi:DUF2254 domain-containing protein [Pseudooceanicola sp. MF1-13]|uniref:DUF2254 domain-containing protein n=1 Tax=Pseudooceanicola sp. MF1-13 TaxID=3379095 RepID=UPI003892075A
MLPTLLRQIHAFSRRLIVRVLLIALCSVLAIVVAKLLGGFIPFGLKDRIGADAVDHILSIIANSMLTVTTFSLTVMVASHRSVSSLWTPRAHQILLQDTTTHTVLATFVGAYLYALITIILRETQVFEGEELVVLFFVTLMVVALIVIAIVRWISHLELLGSLIETAGRTEDKALQAYKLRCDHASLGAHPYDPDNVTDCDPVRAEHTGYVQQIYQDRLQEAAEEAEGEIHLAISVGSFVHRGEVLGYIKGGETCEKAIRNNVSIGSLRNYVQDPGFSLLNLTEIGQRALSPGINDPGTAVDMVRRIARVLLSDVAEDEADARYDRLYVPSLDRRNLVMETLAAIARDGVSHPEVVIALRGSLKPLSNHDDPQLAEAARVVLAAIDKAETKDILDLSV